MVPCCSKGNAARGRVPPTRSKAGLQLAHGCASLGLTTPCCCVTETPRGFSTTGFCPEAFSTLFFFLIHKRVNERSLARYFESLGHQASCFPYRNFRDSSTPVILARQDQLIICDATEDNETWVISAMVENHSSMCMQGCLK